MSLWTRAASWLFIIICAFLIGAVYGVFKLDKADLMSGGEASIHFLIMEPKPECLKTGLIKDSQTKVETRHTIGDADLDVITGPLVSLCYKISRLEISGPLKPYTKKAPEKEAQEAQEPAKSGAGQEKAPSAGKEGGKAKKSPPEGK